MSLHQVLTGFSARLRRFVLGLVMGPPGHKPNTARPRVVLSETEESRQRRSIASFYTAPARASRQGWNAAADDADRIAAAQAKRDRRAAKRLRDAGTSTS